MRALRVGILGVAGVAVLGCLTESAWLGAAPVEVTPTFTSVQAGNGQAAYARSCAHCHGANLDDGEFGPALRGKRFLARWGGRPLVDLFSLVKNTMPPDSPGSLTDRNYTDLVAFLLSQVGVTPTGAELPSDRAALSMKLIPGEPSAVDHRALGPSGGLAPGTVLPPWPAKHSVLDELTPVSDTMLQSPREEDWLSWRQSFADAGFSPLTQVTRRNVGALRLA